MPNKHGSIAQPEAKKIEIAETEIDIAEVEIEKEDDGRRLAQMLKQIGDKKRRAKEDEAVKMTMEDYQAEAEIAKRMMEMMRIYFESQPVPVAELEGKAEDYGTELAEKMAELEAALAENKELKEELRVAKSRQE